MYALSRIPHQQVSLLERTSSTKPSLEK